MALDGYAKQLETLVIKIMRDKFPGWLYDKLSKTVYHESRRPNRLLIFDGSKTKYRFQGIQNCVKDVFEKFDFDNYFGITDDQLHINFKKVTANFWFRLHVDLPSVILLNGILLMTVHLSVDLPTATSPTAILPNQPLSLT